MSTHVDSTSDETAAMVHRLRESKERAEADDRVSGMRSGLAFAARRATYRQLQVLDAMEEEYGDPGMYDAEDGAQSLVHDLATTLRDWHGENHDETDLMDTMFPIEGRRRSPVFLAAFVKTAAEAWRDVAEAVG